MLEQHHNDALLSELHHGAQSMEHLAFLGMDLSAVQPAVVVAQLSNASFEEQLAVVQTAIREALR